MSIKIVTDSTSDISREFAQKLGITIVPGYVRFGSDVYRDGVDLSSTGFYRMLISSPYHPVTSEPTPQDFAKIYSECSEETDEIISIHISSKISRIYSSALQAKKMMKRKSPMEIVDSGLASIGLSMVVMAAARLANKGEGMRRVLEETHKAISQMSMLGVFDTMKYLALGGRVNKAIAALSGMFQIKPLLTFRNGEIVREGFVRTYSRGIDRLFEFVESALTIQDLGVAYSTELEKAEELKERLGSILSEENIHVTQMGTALGVHSGPGALIVAYRRSE